MAALSLRIVSAKKLRSMVSPVLFGFGLLLLWEVLCRGLQVSRFVIPQPSAVGVMLVKRWDVIWPNMITTLSTTLLGLVIGIAIGYILGLALGASSRFFKTVFPALVGINSIPKVALVPLIILWTGLGVKPAIFTSIVIVIFPIATVVAASVASTDSDLRDVLRSLGASRLVALMKISVPQSLPFFLSSLKIAVSLAFIGTIVAESVAANRGLGYMMNRAASDFDHELVFSGVAVLAAIGIALYLISVFLERHAAAWAFRRSD